MCRHLSTALILLFCTAGGLLRAADTPLPNAQQVIHLLDYVAVEYPEFVRDGQVLDAAEYEEQVEFSQVIARELAAFPPDPARDGLVANAKDLADLISARAAGDRVADRARSLQQEIVSAYRIRIAPSQAPDLGQGKVLYASMCAGCHGLAGNGRGPQARGLEPQPTDFTERERQIQRSVLGLFNTISLGVDGTAMAGYSHLSLDERWALAFYVSTFSASEQERAAGKAAWNSVARDERPFQSLEQLVAITPAQARAGGDDRYRILAFLRADPHAMSDAGRADPMSVAIEKLIESERLFRSGQPSAAYQASIAAYLDGFELAEARLPVGDRNRLEQAMASYRSLLKSSPSTEAVSAAATALVGELRQIASAPAHTATGVGASFAGSFIIILREGLEAVLVVAAIVAFLIRAGRRDALKYVHAGWIGALALGAVTWVVSAAVIEISGAQREVTEGVTALLAAAVLLYAGYWLHDRSHAARWQAFIRGQVTGTLSSGQLWGLALVSFLAVYREAFETVLFMQSLWIQGDGSARGALIAGGLTGATALLAAAWAIGRLSMKLPLGVFFGVSAAFLAVLAVIFAGRGVAALQAAGTLPLSPVGFFDGLPALGLYPNVQALSLQTVILAVIVAGFLYTRSTARQQ